MTGAPGPTRSPPRARAGLTAAVLAYILAVLVGCDITVGAMIGARPGETISHYANRHRATWGGPVCAVLDAIDPDHCARVTY